MKPPVCAFCMHFQFFNFQVALGSIMGILLLHSLLAVGFKEYYFDTSSPGQLEIEDMHQHVRSIEHSDIQLKVTSMENLATKLPTVEKKPNAIVEKQVGGGNSSDSKKENDVLLRVTEGPVKASAYGANISKPV